MPASKYVTTDPADPEAPRVLTEYSTVPRGDLLRPGLVVTYVNDAMPGLGNPTPGGEPMTVDELILYPDPERPYVDAILDAGAYECSADNLVPVPEGEEQGSPAAAKPGRETTAAAAGDLSDAAAEAEAEADAAQTRAHFAAWAAGEEHHRGEVPAVEVTITADTGRAAIPAAAAAAAAHLAAAGIAPGDWPDLSVFTAHAFAAYESIQGGAWDPFLPILAGAISARRTTMAAEAVEIVRAAGGDPDDPDDPAWAEAARAWRPRSVAIRDLSMRRAREGRRPR